MDSIKDITNTITNNVEPTGYISSASTGTSFMDRIKNMGFLSWVLIIIILASFGFNIFTYLSAGTNDVVGIFKPLVDGILKLFVAITGQVVYTTAEVGKDVINTTAKITDSALTEIQEITPQGNMGQTQTIPQSNTTTSSLPSQQVGIPQKDVMQNNTLNRALNTSVQQNQSNTGDYQADESTSAIQSGGSKAGWCYIGEDRGFRTCAQVGVNDSCMSGEIFPSQEICINPSLRA